MSSIDNEHSRREYRRIGWRNWVMKQPGGVEWLCAESKKAKYKETAIGPDNMKFPGSEWSEDFLIEKRKEEVIEVRQNIGINQTSKIVSVLLGFILYWCPFLSSISQMI